MEFIDFVWLLKLEIAALMIVSYLIGSVNVSILLSRIITKKDIRKSGSGNAGATNVLRTMGKKYAVITLIIDILKGVIAVFLATRWATHYFPDGYGIISHTNGSDFAELQAAILKLQMPYIAGVCVVLGHNFPIFFGFKGGKGVATSLGVLLMLNWKTGLIVLIFALAVMAITRYVSLGSILAAVLFAAIEIVTMAIYDDFNIIKAVCVIIFALLLIARHHANIGRLLKGTENKLGSKGA